ncbi:MAG: TrkH family potassium uptake protein [Treponema sp.]|nr:TrkH family potassium uptake protein [Treponema sp.]
MTFTVTRITFVILGIVGTFLVLPFATSIALNEGLRLTLSYALPMLASWVFAAAFFFAGKKKKMALSTRASFVTVALSWLFMGFLGAIPLYASGAIPSLTDAIFESISGFTTTGATILSEIECLPRSINLWRCEMHWVGGMGIIVLTVALLPILGVGGFQLIKAETTGPEKGKLTPKITTTAKVLWYLYFAMTVIEAILLKIAGMDFLDAISHAFSTLGTGGFSTKNNSIASFNSAAIDWICWTFMFLAGINFSLYYYMLTKKWRDITGNTEFKVYIAITLIAAVLIAIFECPAYGGFLNALRYSFFQSSTIISSTGFATADFTTWTPPSQAIIFALLFIGGSSGSTAGGVKVIRWVVIAKQFKNEILKIMHPHGVFTIRLNKQVCRKDIVFTVTAFFFIYVLVVAITTLFGAFFGLDLFSAFTGAVTMCGNCGPGFNLLGPSCNYGFLATPIKWLYSLVMIAGRLEFFTIAILFSPAFWKK